MERELFLRAGSQWGKLLSKTGVGKIHHYTRVYTQAHMDVIAESAGRVYERRKSIQSMKMVYEPKYLRFFQAKFEKL